MRHPWYLLICMVGLAACAAPVTTAQKTATAHGNKLEIVSGTFSGGRFISVTKAEKVWTGQLKGGKEKWGARRGALHATAKKEIERICGEWFFATLKKPVYNMLDNDETMGGVAPMLGASVAVFAYLAAEAATEDTNIPSGMYMEFSCPKDEK